MKWFAGVQLFIKLIPCVLMVLKEMKEAKSDDDTIDMEEWGDIAQKGWACISGKFDLDG